MPFGRALKGHGFSHAGRKPALHAALAAGGHTSLMSRFAREDLIRQSLEKLYALFINCLADLYVFSDEIVASPKTRRATV